MVRQGLSPQGAAWAFGSVGYAGNWHPLTWLSHMLDVQLFGLRAGGHHLVSALLHAANAALLLLLVNGLTGGPLACGPRCGPVRRSPAARGVGGLGVRAQGRPERLFRAAGAAGLPGLCTPAVGCAVGGGGGAAGARTDVQTDAGRPAAARAAARLVAARAVCAARISAAAARGEGAVAGAGGRRGRRDPRRAAAIGLAGTDVRRARCAAFLERRSLRGAVPRQDLLALRPDVLLRAATVAAAAPGGRRPGARGGREPCGVRRASTRALAGRGVALVSAGAAPGHRCRAGRQPGHGRPLHLSADRRRSPSRSRGGSGRSPGVAGGDRLYAIAAAAAIAVVALAALTHLQLPSWSGTEALYAHALAVAPGSPRLAANAQYDRGVELGRQGRVAEARGRFEAALRILPSHADAHNNLGAILAKEGRVEEAVPHFEAGLASSANAGPGAVKLHDNLGMAFRLLGRRREAIEQFRAALALDPADFSAHFNLGLLLEEQGSAEEALGHYREAVRIDPGNAKARTMLGQALQEANAESAEEAPGLSRGGRYGASAIARGCAGHSGSPARCAGPRGRRSRPRRAVPGSRRSPRGRPTRRGTRGEDGLPPAVRAALRKSAPPGQGAAPGGTAPRHSPDSCA